MMKRKVAIGYKNPLYLTTAMQVQPAIYNGHEIVKTNHAPVVVHDSEDTLELAEITRKRMLEKVKSPLITLRGLTEGEMGFKQTKECYLTEVIPFLKTLKEHVEGIQTALVKEVKEMKEIFEQIEAEVEQNVMDKQCADIERKNLLIENENLITDCLSHELLYCLMNDVNTISRFSKMHDAYTVEQARCLELEAEISKLKHKIQKDDHMSEINSMKESIQGKDNTIRKLKMQISQMNERRSEADRILDFKALDFPNTELTEKVTALQEQNEIFRCVTMSAVKPKLLAPGMYAIDVEPIPLRNRNNREVHLDYLKHLKESVETLREIVKKTRIEKPLDNALENACFYTKRSQELLEYVIGTCPKEFSKRDKKVATIPLNRNKQVAFKETCETSNNNSQTHVEKQKVHKTNVPMIPSIGVNSSTEASMSKPRSNTKNNRILPVKSDNKKKVEDHLTRVNLPLNIYQ
ncbi:hypothetical protein Tco_0655788 [Tanacetum coccineum]|uniref:Uncharacterized protein n=1 Tax=Tanacetum coccineum TaxID=301880 RepID=A0ABQ4X6Z1_9ASTR